MDLLKLLKGVELFHGLDDLELAEVTQIFKPQAFGRGDLIAEQGKPGDSLFLVADGFVEVTIGDSAQHAEKILVNLGEGQIFGEMALVDQGLRSATVRAISETTSLHMVKREDFEALCERNTRIGYIVMRNIAADLSFKLRQRHLVN
jgi:CRP-like cAMP-binding protein